ncbi:polysaccharide biosynthesis C-terminal domain-containing protein [Nitratireductor sp. XY-223]|uniref:oligosaccharide flippase family protein n=1 Tax=Nitratireductor sp. XY-223 TaxID=2561926 RepID=UPI001FF032F8|nr:polysaccharide biosynthesis C-terminal domain-containing protein [Nitratireductor sp. XY-223]
MRITAENAANDTLAPQSGARRRATGFLHRLLGLKGGQDGHGETRRMSLIAFVIRVISAGIAFLAQIFLARLMGQFEYGIFVFVWVMAIIVGNFACFGFHTALIRFVPQYRAHGEIAKIRGITLTARLFALTSASLVALLGIAAVYGFGDALPPYYLTPLVLGAFMLPMIALGDIMDGTARANSWIVQALTPTYLARPALIPVAMLVAVLLGYEASAKTALIAALIATYVTTLGQLTILGWRLRRRFEAGPKEIEFGYWIKIAMPIFLVEGFYYLLTNADVVMVGFFLPPDQVATYYAAAKTMALVHFVFFAVKAGMAPRFSALVAEKSSGELARVAATAAYWTFWPTIAVGGMVLALGSFLLSLFGPDFQAGYPVMFILFAGVAAKALIGPGEALLTMAGQQKICALIYFAVLLVNIAGNIVLIPVFGINGAAAATMVAMFAETALLFAVIRSRLDINMSVFSRPAAAAERETR